MENERIELSLSACKAEVLPLSLIPQNLVEMMGLEPTTGEFRVRCSPIELHPRIYVNIISSYRLDSNYYFKTFSGVSNGI